MEQKRSEEKTIIEKSLSRGQEVSFSIEQAPAKIELSLGGTRDRHPEETGAKPATLSIYKVSELPKVNDQYVYDGYIIDPTCAYIVASDEYHDFSDPADITGIKGVRSDDQIVIGRGHDRFPNLYSNMSVSRQHLCVSVDEDGVLTIKDTSKYGTVVSYENTSRQAEGRSSWNILENYNPSQNLSDRDAEERIKQLRYEAIFSVPTPKGRDRFGNDLDKRLKVTEESLDDAALAYRFSDPEVKKIIDKYKTEEIWREEDVNSLVRTNNELRVELGKCLLARLGKDSYLPYRVMIDEQKNINYIGYPQVSSREASALLALAMLDGTFKRPKYDPIVMRYGDVELGQHRWAALRALGLDREGDVYIKRVLTIERRPFDFS